MRLLERFLRPFSQATEPERIVDGALEREKAGDLLTLCEKRLWRTGIFHTTRDDRDYRDDSQSKAAHFPEISLVWELNDKGLNSNVAQPDILGLRFGVGATGTVYTDVMNRPGYWDFLNNQQWYADYILDESQLPPKGIRKGSLADQARVVINHVCGGFKQDQIGATTIKVSSRNGLP